MKNKFKKKEKIKLMRLFIYRYRFTNARQRGPMPNENFFHDFLYNLSTVGIPRPMQSGQTAMYVDNN